MSEENNADFTIFMCKMALKGLKLTEERKLAKKNTSDLNHLRDSFKVFSKNSQKHTKTQFLPPTEISPKTEGNLFFDSSSSQVSSNKKMQKIPKLNERSQSAFRRSGNFQNQKSSHFNDQHLQNQQRKNFHRNPDPHFQVFGQNNLPQCYLNGNFCGNSRPAFPPKFQLNDSGNGNFQRDFQGKPQQVFIGPRFSVNHLNGKQRQNFNGQLLPANFFQRRSQLKSYCPPLPPNQFQRGQQNSAKPVLIRPQLNCNVPSNRFERNFQRDPQWHCKNGPCFKNGQVLIKSNAANFSQKALGSKGKDWNVLAEEDNNVVVSEDSTATTDGVERLSQQE